MTVEAAVRMDARCWLRAEWPRVCAWLSVAAAVGSLVVGSRYVAGTPVVASQVAYLISAGFGALFLVVVAVGLLLGAEAVDHLVKVRRLELAVGGRPLPDIHQALAWFRSGTACPELREFHRESGIGRWRVIASGVPVGIGAALIAVGWSRAAGTVAQEKAFEGLVVAGVGLFLAAGVVVLQLVRLRMHLAERQNGALKALRDQMDADVASPPTLTGGEWSAPGLRRFHRSSCPALAAIASQQRPVQEDSGLEPCLICHPEMD